MSIMRTGCILCACLYLTPAGSQAVVNSPAEFARVTRSEYAAWDAVIRNANIRAE